MKIHLTPSLKRQATKILADLHNTKEPVLITEHGKPSAYLVDVEDYEFMQNRLAILEGILRGEHAIAQGDFVSHSEAKNRFSKWYTN
ncbi:type II toxin-antitoxin system Phd/YefM family antitoxin [Vibrio sp. Of14-4]|uniref:type II toxin-antitoxin system Phd/YefM family antitoxin n=1 Tax=Vibrio sp. Of14-4 TaxID=2724878 RepID=UPI001EF3C259|nr:type II toxin-antitoxin system Phd/YefM family antitoxin [Vibrio sp. Of14-4]MCG7488124.1 type II toxin-antitoxin system Phd/YefM family antitoxin [Vibrio sp. Of14-4]